MNLLYVLATVPVEATEEAADDVCVKAAKSIIQMACNPVFEVSAGQFYNPDVTSTTLPAMIEVCPLYSMPVISLSAVVKVYASLGVCKSFMSYIERLAGNGHLVFPCLLNIMFFLLLGIGQTDITW